MSLTAFYEQELVDAGEDKLTLVLNFRAIDIIEGLAGEPMPSLLVRLLTPPPPISLAGKVLWALLREKHEELTLDEAAGLMFSEHGNRVGLAMEKLLSRAFNLDDAPKGKGKNPPKPRGASKPS